MTARYFKWEILSIKNKNIVQFSDFVVRSNGVRIDYSQATATWVGGSIITQTSFGIDNDTNTIFSANGVVGGSGVYTIDFGFPQAFDHYDFYTALNSPNDTPINWYVYVSNDDITYTRIDTKTNQTPPTANTPTLVGPVNTYPDGYLVTLPNPNNPNNNLPCFKEGTLIKTGNGYVPVETLRAGDLIQTLKHGLVPLCMIGVREVDHQGVVERIKDQLYVCPVGSDYPDVFEDLVMTGCHSVLVEYFNDEEEMKSMLKTLGGIYMTDDLFRLPLCADRRAMVYSVLGKYNVYHIALENSDYYMNYGVYANGLLVESCSKRYLKELSGMTLL